MFHFLYILIIGCICRPYGNLNSHSRSFSQSAGKLHLSSHIFYNMLHKRKPQPTPPVFFIITYKILKNCPLKLFFHARSIICKPHGYQLPTGSHQFRIDLTTGITAIFSILNGILHNIDNNLLPSDRIQHHQREVC